MYKKLSSLVGRHGEVLWIVLTVILPIIIKTGRRPVIFWKYSGIGDIISTFPAALELKKRHPGATFIYNCHSAFACLPRLGGVTTCVISSKNIGLVGYWYSFLIGGFYAFASDDDRPHQAPNNVFIKDFGTMFGIDLDDAHPVLQSRPQVIERMKFLIRNKITSDRSLIVIHLGPTWPVKEWPHESWAAMMQELARSGFTNIIQLGVSNHMALGTVTSEAIPGVTSFVDQLTLEESVALISLSRLFIGIDSGLLHVATAVKTPAVGLWGATSPQFLFSAANRRSFIVSAVECQGCHHRVPRLHWMTGCPFDVMCMKTIRMEDVLQVCLKELQAV